MSLITRAIRKQTAIDALARLDARRASVPPMSFILDDRIIWRIANERAYLASVINKDSNK